MKLKNLMQNIWWIGVTLLLILGCSLQGVLTPTPILPTATPIPPTSIPSTSTSIPSTSTPIPPTVPPASPTATNVQVEQARAFADPILTVIAIYPPHFEDDFSTDKGWTPWGAQRPFGVEDGVMRVQLDVANCAFTSQALTRKDFVLQFDARLVVGDMMSAMNVNFHHATTYFYQLSMKSKPQTWDSTVFKPNVTSQIAQGTGLVSPIGEITQVLIIARGPQSAIYINGTPAVYFEDADFDTSGATWFSCESYSQTICEFDNIKLWELVKVPGLP